MGFEIVSKEDCVETDLEGPDRQAMYSKLEKDLLVQIKMCMANQTHFKATGEVNLMNKVLTVSFIVFGTGQWMSL